jgi:hypothetical protein
MTPAARQLLGVSTSTHAVFFGGAYGSNIYYNSNSNRYMSIYNTSLTKTELQPNNGVQGMAGTPLNGGAIYWGGFTVYDPGDDGGYQTSNRNYYVYLNSSLTTSTKSASSGTSATGYPAAGTNSKYAVFAGGAVSGYGIQEVAGTTILYFNKDLTSGKTSLGTARVHHSGGCINDYLVFAGGRTRGDINGSNINTVEAFDINLTRSNLTNLPTSSSTNKSICVNEHYIINIETSIITYDKNLTQKIHSYSHADGTEMNVATAIGNYGLIHTGGIDKALWSKNETFTATTGIGVFKSE